MPTVEKKFVKQIFPEGLEIGQYWVNIDIDECKAGTLTSFSVVEKGGIIDNGLLEKVSNKVWAYVREPIEIIATFKNTGPRTASAKFKGNIKLEDKIVEVIETEEVDVESGETIGLKTFFEPSEPGRYVISGRIIYNRKMTFEKGSILNVRPAPEKQQEGKTTYVLLVIYLVILISILFMIRKIIKAKKKRK